MGNRIWTQDPNGNVIFADYDLRQQRVKDYFAEAYDTDIATTQSNATKRVDYQYTTAGRDSTTIRYDNNGITPLEITAQVHDAYGRLYQVGEWLGGLWATTQFEYDYAAGFDPNNDGVLYQIKITDPESKVTYRQLDHAGRLTRVLYPSNDYEEMKYDGTGVLDSKAVWDGGVKKWITYDYDTYGRRTKTTYPDTGYVEFEYDGFGRKVKFTDSRNSNDKLGGTHTTSYDYDPLGQLTSLTDYEGNVFTYDYRADGQSERVKVKDDQNDTFYSLDRYYDSLNRLSYLYEPTKLLGEAIPVVLYFDSRGNREVLDVNLLGNPSDDLFKQSYSYNIKNELIGYSISALNGPTAPSFTFENVQRDGLGRLTDADESLSKAAGGSVTHVMDYSYDTRSQLTDASMTNVGGSTWTGDYTYHDDGNREKRDINGDVTNYQYDGDHITSAGGQTLDYDLNGNQTQGLQVDIEYTWDNRVRQITLGSTTLSYKYDDMGLRVYREIDDGSTIKKTHLLWDYSADVPRLIAEVDADTGNVERTYLHVGYQAVAVYEGEQVDPLTTRYFLLSDRLGSVRLVVDKTGTIKNRYTYTPYGEETTAETEVSVDQPFQFTGQYLEEDVQLYAFNARMYDPNLAVFLTHDPVRGEFSEPLTLHRYLYTLNDPINNFDPTGEFTLLGTLGTTAKWAGRAWSAYDTANTIKGYAQMLKDGIGLQQVMLSIAADVAVDRLGGKVFEKALQGVSTVVKGISKRLRKTKGHHLVPKWAGGNPRQWLTTNITDTQHIELESAIKKRMNEKFDLQIGGRGGSYDDIMEVFGDNPDLQTKVFAELADIYDEFDHKWPDANLREGFLHNINNTVTGTMHGFDMPN